MGDFLPEMTVGALITVVCALVVIFASRRNLAAGVLLSASVLVTYLAVLWFWPGPPSGQPKGALFATYLASGAVVWCPVSILAVIAGRLSKRGRLALGALSLLAGLLLGAAYIFVALSFACSFMGACL
jgi:hypothetical protein